MTPQAVAVQTYVSHNGRITASARNGGWSSSVVATSGILEISMGGFVEGQRLPMCREDRHIRVDAYDPRLCSQN